MNIEELKKENLDLRRKLSIAKLWMEKEIKSRVTKIAKYKVSKLTLRTKDDFFSENVEDIITKKVSDYFGEIMLLNTPESVILNIISAEIGFYNLGKNSGIDGLSVIISYHKSLDTLIENLIIKGFRKFAKKSGQTKLSKNNLLEKTLDSVVNKGYILGVGKLFNILKLIKTDDILYDYVKCFRNYLNKYPYIYNILLEDNFYKKFKKLVNSEILGKKRHIGRISFKEAKDARFLLIGDYKEKNSIIYKFIEIGKVNY